MSSATAIGTGLHAFLIKKLIQPVDTAYRPAAAVPTGSSPLALSTVGLTWNITVHWDIEELLTAATKTFRFRELSEFQVRV